MKNTFAVTPPMGWNSYDYYDTTVNEEQVRANAKYMAEHLKEYGWEYIVVDIEWYSHAAGSQRDRYQYIPFGGVEMDEYGRLLPDPERFPSSVNGAGFRPLADYVHSLGLKFGIHIMRGIPREAAHRHLPVKGCADRETLRPMQAALQGAGSANGIADPSSICFWNPDMYGVRDVPGGQEYYDSLLELYADWGVDFIKCDDICRMDMPSAQRETEMLHTAILRCGRPIVLSLSPGPAKIEKAWFYETNANMWRITDDFWDDWRLLKDMFRRCELWQSSVREGCYPDCDMLPLGYLGKGFGHERPTNFTRDEQRTMMTLWCLFGSPLMLGAELTKLDEWTLSLLTNRDILGMLTPDCRPRQVCLDDQKAVWKAYNAKTGERYAALFNLGDGEAEIAVSLDELQRENFRAESGEQLTELWTGEKTAFDGDGLHTKLPAHGAVVYRIG